MMACLLTRGYDVNSMTCVCVCCQWCVMLRVCVVLGRGVHQVPWGFVFLPVFGGLLLGSLKGHLGQLVAARYF